MRSGVLLNSIFIFLLIFSLSSYLAAAPPVDLDGDGWKSRKDCDDLDPDVYPGAPELCDGKDNQCPRDAGYGLIDEGCNPVCGDDLIDAGEECDGTDLGGMACVDLGYDYGDLGCTGDCTYDTSSCFYSFCGDGFQEPGEDCDGGDDAACPGQCQGDCSCPSFDVLENGDFATGTSGWAFSSWAGSPAGAWDAAGYADGGSVLIASETGRRKDGEGFWAQTIAETIEAGSTVKLSYAWKKGYAGRAPTQQNIYVTIVKPDGSSANLSSRTGKPASYGTWYFVSEEDVSAYFNQTGTYKICLRYDYKTGRTSSSRAFAWFDEVELSVTSCACTPPSYDPAKWNDGGSVQSNNNCYNYANDEITMTFAQPGRASDCYPWSINCSSVYAAAQCDGLVSIAGGSDTCPDDMQRVYLVIWPGRDYHWYRQDVPDGMWSHKPGSTQATNRDASGQTIYSPEMADTGWYTDHCGYMCACGDCASIQ